MISEQASSAVKAPRPSWRELGAAAITARMLGLFALLVVAAVVCANLGAWQIGRAFERADAARAAEEAVITNADPESLTELLQPGAHVMGTMVGLPVEVAGEFEPAFDLLVPDRYVEGKSGYLVVSALRVSQTQALLPVVRGWVAESEDVPNPPDGEVTLVGALAPGESYAAASLPAGQVNSISPALFASTWGTPIYNAYLVERDATQGLVTVPRPQLDGGGGVDIRNLAYAVEWYVFGGFALFVWYRLVRDEALVRREEAEDAAAAVGADATTDITPRTP